MPPPTATALFDLAKLSEHPSVRLESILCDMRLEKLAILFHNAIASIMAIPATTFDPPPSKEST